MLFLSQRHFHHRLVLFKLTSAAIAFGIFMALFSSPASSASSTSITPQKANNKELVDENHRQCVVLLHGLIRSSDSMSKMAAHLTTLGYRVVNQDYPSTDHPIDTLTEIAIPPAIEACGDAAQIHFVTHSLGGILLRYYISQHSMPKLGRAVMLGPPNRGSEIVDAMGDWALFGWINGPAGIALGTQADSIPNQLGPVHFELGVIAGSRTFNPMLSLLLPSPDDGKVSVENTKVTGMKAHIVMPVTHTFMMQNQGVIEQVSHFLAHGEFQ
ncbi:esterase/lipase family protein [Thaumasiovibrio subtropicus]|uniref:esterase/lipase family protein n=1 Tax=Thaumasiovibrio subtropicus TaxID=1891207 RepID=UPI00192D1865|nr:alpha/beta fold hydrolase [Thaumasiovibrio subtropicus]